MKVLFSLFLISLGGFNWFNPDSIFKSHSNTLVSAQTTECTNTKYKVGKEGNRDDGCDDGNKKICVKTNGTEPGDNMGGDNCARCLNKPINMNTTENIGCSVDKPFCVLEDGAEPEVGSGGTACRACINTKHKEGKEGKRDKGCDDGNKKICVKTNGKEPEPKVSGNLCVRCLNKEVNSTAGATEHIGCSVDKPFCVLEDGTEPQVGSGGTACRACINTKYEEGKEGKRDKGCDFAYPNDKHKICVKTNGKEPDPDQGGKVCARCLHKPVSIDDSTHIGCSTNAPFCGLGDGTELAPNIGGEVCFKCFNTEVDNGDSTDLGCSVDKPACATHSSQPAVGAGGSYCVKCADTYPGNGTSCAEGHICLDQGCVEFGGDFICSNTRGSAKQDYNCDRDEDTICTVLDSENNYAEPEDMGGGTFCARCLNKEARSDDSTHIGCSTNEPFCVLDDGTQPPVGFGGTACRECLNKTHCDNLSEICLPEGCALTGGPPDNCSNNKPPDESDYGCGDSDKICTNIDSDNNFSEPNNLHSGTTCVRCLNNNREELQDIGCNEELPVCVLNGTASTLEVPADGKGGKGCARCTDETCPGTCDQNVGCVVEREAVRACFAALAADAGFDNPFIVSSATGNLIRTKQGLSRNYVGFTKESFLKSNSRCNIVPHVTTFAGNLTNAESDWNQWTSATNWDRAGLSVDDEVWIGVTRNSTGSDSIPNRFEWANSEGLVPELDAGFKKWGGGQPNEEANPSRDCLRVKRGGGNTFFWANTQCANTLQAWPVSLEYELPPLTPAS